MRTEMTDTNWRIRLGERARQLMQQTMSPDEKPDGDILDRALARQQEHIDELRMSLTAAEARVEAGIQALAISAEAVRDLQIESRRQWDHNGMMLGMVFRQLYISRQILAAAAAQGTEAQEIIEKGISLMDRMQETYERLVPQADRRYPGFDEIAEMEMLNRMKLEATLPAKSTPEKGKAKEEERER